MDIYKISSENNVIVFNDISLYQLRCCESKCNNVLYTNDNILDLSFKNNIFDVSYCKNTLHHMNNDDEIIALLNNMYNISNKLVIVEIEDPKKVGGISKILNKYLYVDYLKDSGKYFLSFCKFFSPNKLINLLFILNLSLNCVAIPAPIPKSPAMQ